MSNDRVLSPRFADRRQSGRRRDSDLPDAGPLGMFSASANGQLLRFDPVFAQLLSLPLRPVPARPLTIRRLFGTAASSAVSRALIEGFSSADCDLSGHRAGRVLLPADFLPAARRRGMAAKIDLWVIRQALRQLKPRSAFPAPTEFCLVKLSAESLHDHRFQRETLDLLQAHPGAACRLRIELNGRYALRLSRRILDFVDQLQQCGSRVVLTGWMALPVWMPDVVGLRPAAMKLDVSTLASGPHRAESLRCIQTLVDACRDLQIETCAARVESQEVLALARETGFDQVQGYLFGRPESLQAGSAEQEQAASS